MPEKSLISGSFVFCFDNIVLYKFRKKLAVIQVFNVKIKNINKTGSIL